MSAGLPPARLGTGGRASAHDVANYLSRRSASFGGPLVGTGRRERLALAHALAHEAEYAVAQDRSAVGWYDARVKEAMGLVCRLHPELRRDAGRGALFKALLAVTSNGQNVFDNFRRADELYAAWKAGGRARAAGEL
jgi:hypothetical protein